MQIIFLFTGGNKATFEEKFVDNDQQSFAFTLQQTFLPIIWIEGEGDRIETRLSFKTFSTLCNWRFNHRSN